MKRIDSAGACGLLWEYTTKGSTGTLDLFEPSTSNPIRLWGQPGYLTYLSITVDTPPATGVFFVLYDRSQTGSVNGSNPVLSSTYKVIDVSPLMVPQLTAAGAVASGLQYFWAPPDFEWIQIGDVKTRIGDAFKNGLMVQMFDVNGDPFEVQPIFIRARGLSRLPLTERGARG